MCQGKNIYKIVKIRVGRFTLILNTLRPIIIKLTRRKIDICYTRLVLDGLRFGVTIGSKAC